MKLYWEGGGRLLEFPDASQSIQKEGFWLFNVAFMH